MPATSLKSLVDFFLDSTRNELFAEQRWRIDVDAESGQCVLPVSAELVECVFNFREAINTGGGDHTFKIFRNGSTDTGSVITVPDGTPAGGYIGRPNPRVYYAAGDACHLESQLETTTPNSFTRMTYVFRKT